MFTFRYGSSLYSGVVVGCCGCWVLWLLGVVVVGWCVASGLRSVELRDSVGEIWALLARYRTLQEIADVPSGIVRVAQQVCEALGFLRKA